MIGCQGCADQSGALYINGCRSCAIRALASGPDFFASMRAGTLTPEYVAALRALGDPAEVHAEVRDAAKQHTTGAIRA